MSFLDSIINKVDKYVRNEMSCVSANDLGLDSVIGTLYVDSDSICVRKSKNNTLRYYGGFEYIDDQYITMIGNWVFYSREDNRVEDALSFLECEQDCSDYENSQEES